MNRNNYDGGGKFSEPYWVSPDTPDNLFNREIIKPKSNALFPSGAIGIRCDDDFWAVAALPFNEYENVPLSEIVSKFWPRIAKPVFLPDTGDV